MSIQIKVSEKAYQFIIQKNGEQKIKTKKNITLIETVDRLLFGSDKKHKYIFPKNSKARKLEKQIRTL
jgi:hypothetical protein